MKTNNIKEMFEKFKNPEFFSRFDNNHQLEWFIGLDNKGRLCLKLRGTFIPKKLRGTSSIEIIQFISNDFNTIQFSLINNEVRGLFYNLCLDFIESTRNISSEGSYDYIVNRFTQWKRLFVGSSKKIMSEPEVMGLIGELYFLKSFLFKKYNTNTALIGWSGIDNTHKDFSYDDNWYEIKATNYNSLSVKISSLEQLDSENDGILTVVFLEKMSEAFNGIKLNKIIMEIRELLSFNEKEIFDNKLEKIGYDYNDYYDIYCYSVRQVRNYRVDDNFPRIKRDNLPKSISRVQYDILLNEINKFEVKEGFL